MALGSYDSCGDKARTAGFFHSQRNLLHNDPHTRHLNTQRKCVMHIMKNVTCADASRFLMLLVFYCCWGFLPGIWYINKTEVKKIELDLFCALVRVFLVNLDCFVVLACQETNV